MSDRPRILVLGVGSIGERHLRCFLATKRCEAAFAEPMEERRREVAERYPVSAYTDWNEALASSGFDGAVIAAPAPYHVPTGMELAKRGLHLLIEKPVSLNLEGVDELAALVEEKRLQVAVGFNCRRIPALAQMREAVVGGRFGRPVQINVVAGQHFPFYRPAYREIYYARHDMGGGCIQDALPHHLNATEWIVGPATKVVADAEHCLLEGVEVEDAVHLLTRHGDVMGTITLNQHQPPNEFTITVLCERGAARFDLSRQSWLSAEEIGGEWKLEDTSSCERDEYYTAQANDFLDQIAKGTAPLCSLADGVQTLKSVLAIQKSLRSGRWEEVRST